MIFSTHHRNPLHGELLTPWFDLGYETFTTSFVLVEIKREHQKLAIRKFVSERALQIEDIPSNEWDDVLRLSQHWNVSITDASVVHLAKQRNAVLLTGDGILRKQSLRFDLTVHGTLWVIDHLLELKHISSTRARQALTSIVNSGTFLPPEACQKRLEHWR